MSTNIFYDSFQIEIVQIILSVSISVIINFSLQSTNVYSISYTFLYNSVIPAHYQNNLTSSPYPYYLPSSLASYPYPNSFATFDLYILNGLVLPSLKNNFSLFSNVTDLKSIYTPIITTTNIKYTNYLQNNYFTISFTPPTTSCYISSYTININYSNINYSIPTGLLTTDIKLQNIPVLSGIPYTFSVTANNPYNSIESSICIITPITIAPLLINVISNSDSDIFTIEFSGVNTSNYYEITITKPDTTTVTLTEIKSLRSNLSFEYQANLRGLYLFNIHDLDLSRPSANGYFNY